MSSPAPLMARRVLAVCLIALCCAGALQAQQNATWGEWNQAVPPIRIAGPLYYVGMAQVTSLLVTTSEGHILIDGDFPESASKILENVRTLGFKPEEVRILLSTHAHIDHAGGLAEIKARTGGRLYAGAADAPALARGGKGDQAFGDELAFPPVKADIVVEDGDEVRLGDVTVRALATPGHTPGCTSWAFTIRDEGRTLRVLMVGGTSAPGYQLVANTKYPTIGSDFERTFAKLKAESPDIFLEGHGFNFGLDEKRAQRRSFVDPAGYVASLAKAEAAFRKQLAEQTAAAASR
jgi:metallo-beta-lactamase class B